MPVASLTFVVFSFVTIVAYYIVPKHCQWMVLLAASIVFYLSAGLAAGLWVLATATSIFFAACRMEDILTEQKQMLAANKGTWTRDQKKEIKTRDRERRKRLLLGALVLNIGLLCVAKYTHFVLEQVDSLVKFANRGGVRCSG